MTKTLLISSFHSHISRNILATKAFSLLAARRDLQIVVVVPIYKKQYFEDTFGGDGRVIIEGVKQYQASRTRRGLFFKRLGMLLFDTGTTRAKKRYKYYWDRKLLYFLVAMCLGWVGRSLIVRRAVRFLDLKFSSPDLFGALMDAYHPDAVFSTDIQDENDVALMQDARRRHIPVIGMLRSWDNTTQRILRVLPDRLLVGSEALREEVVRFYRYPEVQMALVGHPHYDRYVHGPLSSRDVFFRQRGFDTKKTLILYAAGGDKIIRKNDIDQYVMEILGALPVNVLVRYPPGEDIRLVNYVCPPNTVIEKPGVRFSARHGEFEIQKSDDDTLIDELCWSDIVISGPTTILLDGVLVDKPVIAVDCYPSPRPLYARSWGYFLDHMRKLINTGGVRYVASREEFLAAIASYLRDPSQDQEGRARSRALWFSHADGASGERLAREICMSLDLDR